MSLIFLRFTVSYVAENICSKILKTFFFFFEKSLEEQFLVKNRRKNLNKMLKCKETQRSSFLVKLRLVGFVYLLQHIVNDY
jgi:hypothetical protein